MILKRNKSTFYLKAFPIFHLKIVLWYNKSKTGKHMTQSLITRINSYYDNLSKSDQAISNYLIENMDSAARLSIQEFAKNTKVSTATISRFAKKSALIHSKI